MALLGRNGSGKSTALRLIAGIYQPSDGTVETSGRITAVIELGAGFHPELTGAENIALYAAVLGLTRRELAAAVRRDRRVRRDGATSSTRPLKYYSSGMEARLAFSVAVCLQPDILLLDEVLAVGDQAFRERCLERLRAYHARGGTLILVSHELDQLRELCSRGIWLADGRVVMDGRDRRRAGGISWRAGADDRVAPVRLLELELDGRRRRSTGWRATWRSRRWSGVAAPRSRGCDCRS